MNKKLLTALAFTAIMAGCDDGGNPAAGGAGVGCGGAVYLTDAEISAKGEFTDARDCKVYRAVKIGDLIWMAENLNYNTMDGNGSYCYYKFDSDKGQVHYDDRDCETFGRYYDWATAMAIDPVYLGRSWNGSDANHRGICPDGWRLPNHRDWDNLIRATGDPHTAAIKLKAIAPDSKYSWYNSATDEFGFAALPAAYRGDKDAYYYYLKYHAYWWTSTQYDYTHAMYWHMHYRSDAVEDGYDRNKLFGHNVRCVRG